MAIISGGRINIWNAVKKQFEVVHPETEVARITDFADGIVQKLALTSAMTAVTALQTDSWFGKLLKMALTASGVKYSIAQNGYVCLGSLFGGLIIQWGLSNTQIPFTYPIAFPNSALCATSMHYGASTSVIHVINGLTSTSANIITNASTDYAQYVFVIGY